MISKGKQVFSQEVIHTFLCNIWNFWIKKKYHKEKNSFKLKSPKVVWDHIWSNPHVYFSMFTTLTHRVIEAIQSMNMYYLKIRCTLQFLHCRLVIDHYNVVFLQVKNSHIKNTNCYYFYFLIVTLFPHDNHLRIIYIFKI